MLDIANLFIAKAYAQDAGAAPGGMAGLMNFLPLILIFVVFYVLIIRPQQKKMAEQDRMIKALQRGDRVITSGGIYGKITKLEDDTLTVEIADGVNVKMVRAQVQGLAAKPNVGVIATDANDEKKN